MKITSVKASTHDVAVDVPLIEDKRTREVVFIQIETTEGITGYGLTSKKQWFGVRSLINREIAPILEGMSPLRTEETWTALEDTLNPRIQTGVWSSAISGVDIALWDIKGKYLDEPVWKLLGGAQRTVPAYITMGLSSYNKNQLCKVAKMFLDDGQRGFKMKVGDGTPVHEDAERVSVVRNEIGESCDLMIDANYSLSINEAVNLCNRIEDLNLTFFEEPIYGNDVSLLRNLRERTKIPISAGQNEGNKYRHRKLIAGEAVDISQPNVVFCGGYTEGKKIASFAQTYNLKIANGAGFPHHNKHLHAAMPNGWFVEYHLVTWKVEETLYKGLSGPDEGTVTLSEDPGLGVEPDWNALEKYEVE